MPNKKGGNRTRSKKSNKKSTKKSRTSRRILSSSLRYNEMKGGIINKYDNDSLNTDNLGTKFKESKKFKEIIADKLSQIVADGEKKKNNKK